MIHLRAAGFLSIALAVAATVPASADWAEVRRAIEDGDAVALVAALQPLAEAGDPDAQYNLGILHDTGQGVPQDYREAARWYGMAGEQNHASALYNLGLLHFEGKGVERDEVKAIGLYREAARYGDADALSSIGYMFLHGIGVEEDQLEGLAFFLLAAERGSSSGAHNRDNVLGRFDTNDFAFARARSRDLAVEYPAP